ARATPWAWLPADAAMTPRAFSSAVSEWILVSAPRTLNDPARCRFSAFRKTGSPKCVVMPGLWSSGVRLMRPFSRARALSMSSTVTVTRGSLLPHSVGRDHSDGARHLVHLLQREQRHVALHLLLLRHCGGHEDADAGYRAAHLADHVHH